MDTEPGIIPPLGEEDIDGARRAFGDFLVIYKPTLERIEIYLEQIIEQAGTAYAEAYRPWRQGLHELFRGATLISKKIPLSHVQL